MCDPYMINFVNITVDRHADLPLHSLNTQTLDRLKDREECLNEAITALLKLFSVWQSRIFHRLNT